MSSLEHELLRHAAALRTLARTLVGPDADDLVQDTVLEALARPPRRPGALFGWLRAVARHLSSTHRRDAWRRRQGDAHAPVREPEPGAVDAAAHREILQRLHATLMGLPEPYLAALLARFFEDLTPSQIAARAGVPVATVKSQLHRGLAMLRDRLDRRGTWRLALFAALGIDPPALTPTGVGAAALGGFGMAKIMQWAIACAVLVAMVGWACWPAPPVSAAAAAPGASPTAAVASIPAEPPPERTAAVSVGPALRFAVLAADDGAPLAPDRVEFAFDNERHRVEAALHGSTFEVPRPASFESVLLRVQGERLAATDFRLLPAELANDGATNLRVRRVVPVRLRVISSLTAAPVPSASILLDRKEPSARPGQKTMQQSVGHFAGTSDDAGRATFAAVPPGIYTVSTNLNGWIVQQPGVLLVTAPEIDATVWLARADGGEVHGRVVDAMTHGGLGGVSLLLDHVRVVAVTDAAGSFVLPGEVRRAARQEFFRLEARPATGDHDHAAVYSAGPFAWSDAEVVVELPPSGHFLRFDLGGGGEPVLVEWCKSSNRLPPVPEPWHPLAKGDDGRYELPWDPDWESRVCLRAEWAPGSAAGAPRFASPKQLPVVLEAGGQVHVWQAPRELVLDVAVREAETKVPIVDAVVEAVFQTPGRGDVRRAELVADYDPTLTTPLVGMNRAQALRTVRTDGQGHATVRLPVAAGVWLRVHAPGHRDGVVPVAGVSPVEVDLQRGGNLRGEIANIEGGNPRVYLVAPRSADKLPPPQMALERGAFHFEGLPLGSYRVFLVVERGRQRSYLDLGDSVVAAEGTTEFRGSALGLRTIAVSATSRDLVPGDELKICEAHLGFEVARATVEQPGTVKFSLPPGSYRVMRMRPEPGLLRPSGVFADGELLVAEPECRVEFVFPRGMLRCRLLDGGWPAVRTWVQVVGSSFEGITRTDADGQVRFPVLPGSSFELARVEQVGSSWVLDWPRWRLGPECDGQSVEAAGR